MSARDVLTAHVHNVIAYTDSVSLVKMRTCSTCGADLNDETNGDDDE